MGHRHSKRKDMAICLVLFNPAQTKRILMNYFYTRNQFQLQGLPVYTLELVYEGRQPEIPDAFHVSTKSFMFHKENLYRVLVSKIPPQYTKLAFLDCDVFYKDPSWYSKTSKLLDTYDIVQGFQEAHWLDLTYQQTILTRKTVLLNSQKKWDFLFHPGFAWCMRRDYYNEVGFFDWAVSGSGDTLSSAFWLQKVFPDKFQSLPKAITHVYSEYCSQRVPKITYLQGFSIYHLYHGSRVNRQYAERHKLLNVNELIEDMIVFNEDGIFEWVDPVKWNPVFLQYFQRRQDDDLGVEETVKAVRTS